MFFVVSKIFWVLASPGNLLLLLLGLGVAGLFTRFFKRARVLLAGCVVALALAGPLPLGVWLLRPLENRFPQPPADMAAPTGIIVLGGGVDDVISEARGTTELTVAGSRMTEAAGLMRRFPQARLVFTGGSAALTASGTNESDVARKLFPAIGLAPEQVVYEDRSRNTWENAVFTRELVGPKAGETWLLLTSAVHMPRSVGVFRQAGFPVVPYPVNYSTTGRSRELWRPSFLTSEGLTQTDRAVREYFGLVAYWAAGRSSALFPAP
ncbi:MAG: YdcF family protein [Hyphomicrobiales bacterium]|jgi:uncharacterized SAM-binding protein YcdF (DUF218 family)|nr:YdcF family protein [Hyphomicrobiales bacterium]